MTWSVMCTYCLSRFIIFYTIRFKFGHLTLTMGYIYCRNLIMYLYFSYRQSWHSIQILLSNLFNIWHPQRLCHVFSDLEAPQGWLRMICVNQRTNGSRSMHASLTSNVVDRFMEIIDMDLHGKAVPELRSSKLSHSSGGTPLAHIVSLCMVLFT